MIINELTHEQKCRIIKSYVKDYWLYKIAKKFLKEEDMLNGIVLKLNEKPDFWPRVMLKMEERWSDYVR